MLNLLLGRRSVRKFKDVKVEDAKIDELIEGAITSPSGRNLKSSELVVVENSKTLKKLSDARGLYSRLIANAPLAFVIIGDTRKSTTWMSDTAIMASYIQLLAESLGLKSCWVHIENRMSDDGSDTEQNVRDILNIPIYYVPHCILAVGYPDEIKKPYVSADLDYTKVHREHF